MLPTDLVCCILSHIGQSTEAFCIRWSMRSICRLFHTLVPSIASKLSISDYIIQNIIDRKQRHMSYPINLMFDVDDMIYVHLATDRNLYTTTFVGYPPRKLLYHRFSDKYIFSNSKAIWRSSNTDMLQDSVVSKIELPILPSQDFNRAYKKRRTILPHDLLHNMVTSLASVSHSNVSKVTCKETSLTQKGFEILADLLKKNPKIQKLNVSCHMNEGFSDFFVPVFRVYSLVYLNIGFCGCLSINEGLSLIQLIKTNSLKSLKAIGTEIPWFEYFIATLALSSIEKLHYSLPRESCISASYIVHLHKFKSLMVYDDLNQWYEPKDELQLILEKGVTWAWSDLHPFSDFFDDDYFTTFSFRNIDECQMLVNTLFNSLKANKTTTNKKIDASTTDETVPRVVLKLKYPSLTADDATTDNKEFPFSHELQNKRYNRRNQRLNQLISIPQTCKSCNVTWPIGSIKLHAFEGMQNMCHLGKRMCRETCHYRYVFE